MDDPPLLDAGRIGELFRAVNTGLGAAAVRAPVEVVVVGGAAIAMLWNPGRTTYDVDVVSEGIPAVFWDVVADVGRNEGLTAGWLNAAARVKAPTGATPGEPTAIYVGSHLRVYGASPHYVLAMKLLTGRGVDTADIPVLLDAVQPTGRDELYDLVERAYPTAQIPASARYLIDQSWTAYAADNPDRVQRGVGQRREQHVSVTVRPAIDRTDGWEMVIRSSEGEDLRRSPLYPTRDQAEAAVVFAVEAVDVHYPLHFPGADTAEANPNAVTVRVVPAGSEHRLVAEAPNGERVAYTDPYPAVAAYSTLAFVETLSRMVGDPRGRRAMRVDFDTTCDCPALRKGPCRHDNLPTHHAPQPTQEPAAHNPETGRLSGGPGTDHHLGGSPAIGVSVRPFPLDGHGWEVTATNPDGSTRQLSGPHPTVDEAEQARDFLVRLVNVHPRLRILGGAPPPSSGSGVGSNAPLTRDVAPTAGITADGRDGPWYVQCRNPDGTQDTTSPPYPTYQAASAVLDQLGLLHIATADQTPGQRAVTEPTSTTCHCSLRGWRCHHIEVARPKRDPPDRGYGLSL